jgi:lysophospholipid acyltransferase (LPLAT)-like uncharacterized protein
MMPRHIAPPSRFWRRLLGSFLAFYLRLIGWTTRFEIDPPDGLDRVQADMPVIVALWHGQHFMIPLARRAGMRFAVLISKHGDGEINAVAASRLGIELIRGSGAHEARKIRQRGGIEALRSMMAALREGISMSLTADVPKRSRVAGEGIIQLARVTGRPIYPVTVIKKNRIDFQSWDRASIGLPFGRGVIAIGEPIRLARDADAAAIEAARLALEQALDALHARAYARLGSTDPGANRPTVDAARRKAREGAAAGLSS